jgi:RNA polymerase alpha subunit
MHQLLKPYTPGGVMPEQAIKLFVPPTEPCTYTFEYDDEAFTLESLVNAAHEGVPIGIELPDDLGVVMGYVRAVLYFSNGHGCLMEMPIEPGVRHYFRYAANDETKKVLLDYYGTSRVDEDDEYTSFEPAWGPAEQSLYGETTASFEELTLSPRVWDLLHENGCSCLDDVTDKSASELLAIKGFGKSALQELKEALAERELTLTEG